MTASPALYVAPANVPRSAPRLETERLILREFRIADLDAHAATLGDPEVMRFIGGKPMSREDSWRRLCSGVGSWQLVGIGPWAVELKADGRMVGHCGFFEFQREILIAGFDYAAFGKHVHEIRDNVVQQALIVGDNQKPSIG